MRILVIGYGNPGRLDDGLGPAFAEIVESWHLPDVTVEADYQLTVEDAAIVAQHSVVIFVDASLTGEGPFYFEPITPRAAGGFTSHSVDPRAVLALAESLFGGSAKAFVLGIRGYEFNEFGEELSEPAKNNLSEALAFLRQILSQRNPDVWVAHPN